METVKDGCDSLNACVWICWRWGSLWDWNGLSWKRFVENQCGGRRGRGGKPDLVGKGGVGKESHRRDSTLYQRYLSSPRVGWMRSSVGAWWGRENCRTWCLEGGNVSKVSPGIDW